MQSHQPGVARCMASPFRHRFTIPSLIGWRFLWLMLMGSGMLLSTAAIAVTDTWQDISASVQIDHSNPIRSRRSPDAKVTVEITNTGTQALSGPIRLVLDGLTPDTVSLSGASGTTASGAPYIDLSAYMGDTLAPGVTTSMMTLVIAGGGSATFSFNPLVERQQTDTTELNIDITGPNTLITVGSTPLQVSGTLSDPNAVLTVNGMAVSHDGGDFSAAVSLEEGHNTIVARAVSAGGNEVTDSIVVSLDTTPPYITVDSPQDGATVSNDSIAVSGLVNDIVRGTVSEGQANVTVNGVAASVNNRSYLAQGISLSEGANTIIISASDQVGNSAQKTLQVTYKIPDPKRITLVDGQNQSGDINSVLSESLSVKLLNSDGTTPVANKSVIFRVIQGDGIVALGSDSESQAVLVTSDDNGVAQTTFKLGNRSGTGNHKVRARAVGFDGEVVFYASATAKTGNKVSVNSGNNQRAAINQPLPQPFIVAVTDEGANVVEGAQVEFKVTQGGGQFQNGQNSIVATTDSDGRASSHLTLGSEAGLDVQRVTATLVGTNFSSGFTASGLVTGDPGQTKITGVVLDNQDTPLPGVTIRVDGTNRQASTDEQGQFTITESPVGPVHLFADGSTTSVEGEWPTLSYNIVTVAGAENPLAAPIYLVKLDTTNAALVGGAKDITLTLPEVPGFELKVFANSVTFPDGSKEGLISVTPVNASKVPMAPPNGMQPQFIVTIQPAGAVFDPPAPLTLPNVDGHAPGAQVEMYSYDHDLEEFVAIGLGTVSADSTVIESNIGVGVIKAGWHCGSQPGGSGCCNGGGSGGGGCSMCQKSSSDDCSNNDCEPDDSQDPGACKKCSGGSPVNDDSDTPTGDNAKCEKCEDGQAIADSSKNNQKCSDSADKACYTCKSGKCGNHCQVLEPSIKNTVTSSGDWDKLTNIIKQGFNKIPWARASLGYSFSGTNEVGTECCVKCTSETSSPQPFQKLTGAGKVEGKVEVVIPGTGAIGDAEIWIFSTFFTDYYLFASWKFGVFIDGSVNATASVSTKVTSCPLDDNCFSGSIGAAGSLAGGLTGGASGGFKCVQNDEIVDQFGLGGKVEGRAVTGYSIQGTATSGGTCGENKCEIGHDGVKLEAEITYDIDLGIFSDSFTFQVSTTVVDPGKSPC